MPLPIAPADLDAILAYGGTPRMVFARLCLERGWTRKHADYVWGLCQPIIAARERLEDDIPF